eukprot:TRINITY_DN3803_c0_g1_i1.p1 TRINITY_DN3803_c0_g1~~TRINITY_DN3803_c0_g1_i1.p1  ORF type:complete len:220 (+),score=26.09 TRINITY_DN3803_c0_g1_i1:336-995(+)
MTLDDFMALPDEFHKRVGISRMFYNPDRSIFIQLPWRVLEQTIRKFDLLLHESLLQNSFNDVIYMLNTGRARYKGQKQGGEADSSFTPDLVTSTATPTLVLEVGLLSESRSQLVNVQVPFWIDEQGACCVVVMWLSLDFDLNVEVYRKATGSHAPVQSCVIKFIKDQIAPRNAAVFSVLLADIFPPPFTVPAAVAQRYPSGQIDFDLALFQKEVGMFLP